MFRNSTPIAVALILFAFALTPFLASPATATDSENLFAPAAESASAEKALASDSEPAGVLDALMQFVAGAFSSGGEKAVSATAERPWDRGPGYDPDSSPR